MSQEIFSVILGGGAGTRLQPLTSSRSKPAVPIAGKYRLVDIPISNCLNSGVNRMFVLTMYNSASLNRHIKNTYQFSIFSKAFVDILAAEQTPDNPTWFQGTADAVRQGLRHLQPFPSDYILILSGDQLYQFDFMHMLQEHKDKGADITIATIPVAAREASEFGILKTEDGFISSFIEKPKSGLEEWVSDTGDEMRSKGRVYLASMGIYIFNRQLLFDLLQNEKKDATDFGKEIIPQSIGKYKVSSYQYEGYWEDIGNIRAFYEANLALTKDLPEFNLFDNNNSIFTRPRMLPPAKLSGTTIEKSIIAEGSIINASRVENSIVGIRSRIGHDTTLISTYLMGNDYFETLDQIHHDQEQGVPILGIGNRCHIEKAIIDKECRIGNDVKIMGGDHLEDVDHPLYTIKDGIIVVKKSSVLPDGFTIGVS
ncbi:MAG: glucose-1-phosphate adenylyltransferase [Flavisolibacter sp.]|nr:glucose-1-phosphate adenylyltransferase [Flavisolibacter sp.]MBD0295066.1 glucose-1-phosphate adenylyltransferase [Flavisolibacter sp.]MBD0353239.1 glucose-1-phosphate adenylyltransferase [Flavisolibacter sp.]MBD0366836.1 glucose-1-phosphate adenylyltransferase [Flavisolibacter sp.]MBD0374734.1 glucose-1-phosphate adenylyltransferase [Flavisolibacter sp.]